MSFDSAIAKTSGMIEIKSLKDQEFSYKNFFLHSVARKFILYALLISIVISTIGAFFNFNNAYQQQVNDTKAGISYYAQKQVTIIEEILLINDRHLLESAVNSVLDHYMVERVVIIQDGEASITVANSSFEFNPANPRHYINSFPLYYQENGQDLVFGTLEITSSSDNIYNSLKIQSMKYLMMQFIEIIIICCVIFFLFFSMVGKHLIAISKYAIALKLGHLDKPIEFTRKETRHNRKDEISRLVEAMNTMRLNLKEAYQKGQLAEIEREELISTLQLKNEELERFTYTVSHDLKSPLVTINGFIGMLEEDVKTGDKEDIQNDIATIKTAAKTMHSLLNDLLELSRVGVKQGERVAITFNDLIPEVLISLRKQIDSKNAVITIEDNLPTVLIEKIRFSEVFLNLIENALKYMEDQPAPLVQVGSLEAEDALGNKETVFFVKDNGRGINPSYCEKIFELFERIAVDVEGTGVGLAIVKRIIEVHGGRIWVNSAGEGQGATFYFVLPTIKDPSDD